MTVFLGKNEGKVKNRCGRKRKKLGFSAVFLKFPHVWSPALDPCGAGGRFRKDQRPVQFPKTVFWIPSIFWWHITKHQFLLCFLRARETSFPSVWSRTTQHPSSLWKNTPRKSAQSAITFWAQNSNAPPKNPVFYKANFGYFSELFIYHHD